MSISGGQPDTAGEGNAVVLPLFGEEEAALGLNCQKLGEYGGPDDSCGPEPEAASPLFGGQTGSRAHWLSHLPCCSDSGDLAIPVDAS
jgi:hypothetical protein